jgi:prepilin-type N-terminal cleavage/methylation domain-containing protein
MKRKKGFTVIEMMVAMAVLSMLVIAMSRIFQQSLVATDTGYNLVKGNLVGRTIMQYVADDLSNCTDWFGGNEFEFERIVTDSNAWLTVGYKIDSGGLKRKTDVDTDWVRLFEPSDNKTVEFNKDSLGEGFYIEPDNNNNPKYFNLFISVKVKKYEDADDDSTDIRNFATRVYLQNNNRYDYGEYSEL